MKQLICCDQPMRQVYDAFVCDRCHATVVVKDEEGDEE